MTTSTEGGGLLKITQVAEMLAVSPWTVRRLTRGGEMPPPVRVGASHRWLRADLEAWLREGCPRVEEVIGE